MGGACLRASRGIDLHSSDPAQKEPEAKLRKYHHVGIPTEERRAGERYLPEFKMYVSGFEDGPYGVEWMRFEPDSPIPPLVQRVPHVAFEVDDLEAELEGQDVLIEPNSPSPGVRVAFIVHNGAPVEFLEIDAERAAL
jgi:hypothetical protein